MQATVVIARPRSIAELAYRVHWFKNVSILIKIESFS